MNANWCICGVVTALAILASPVAVAQEPLQMDLHPLFQPKPLATAPRASAARVGTHRRSFNVPQPQVLDRDRRLTDRRESRQDVLSSLGVGLVSASDDLDLTAPTTATDGFPQLRFKKRGSLDRDIKRGYRNMGENLAKKVFDDPRGKRIVFDVEGKPGVGVEIPLR
jgi:hypothetical protein